jgi:hypothetical protein
MKELNRWQDWVSGAAGLFTAVAILFTRQEGMSTTHQTQHRSPPQHPYVPLEPGNWHG